MNYLMYCTQYVQGFINNAARSIMIEFIKERRLTV